MKQSRGDRAGRRWAAASVTYASGQVDACGPTIGQVLNATNSSLVIK